jgi:hypothetical protein
MKDIGRYLLPFILSSAVLLSGGQATLQAQLTQRIYLSGTGFDKTKTWEFYCTAGNNSGIWTTIQVPSCWEQEGFGQYTYGHLPFDQRLKEEGQYRTYFEVDKGWKGQHIALVFEGVNTDCKVLVNGRQAGEVHQGAFYEFSYDISKLVKYGKENKLEVFVKKSSDNMSVNTAERKADYWVFGGIFRPVYLEVRPQSHIQRVAVDASADGGFKADVFLSGKPEEGQVEVRIIDESGMEKARFKAPVNPDSEKLRVAGQLSAPELWNPESPYLYTAEFRWLDATGQLIHQLAERIGFRTVEVREQDGIYVNDVRIKYKGVCRHSFHPDHGRTSSKAFSIEVVNLLKDMNMNAVRMSHYPPDRHFLDVCDSLGLFVLDELAGWQKPPYDSVVGRKLLREMIYRDVNHPSIVMWDNGNEGGWNTVYDKDFKELDIQEREVTHPWAVHGKTNTAHYVEYDYLSLDHFAPRKVFFPTELIHGLYDGGHGAGLEDFWLRMWNHPLSAGAFLWVFSDEAIKRSDTGELDSDGNHAPDGILGPYHEKEGSFFTIRELWAPIHFEKRYITPEFNGKFRIQNRFHYTRLDQCSFTFNWIKLPDPSRPGIIDPGSLEQGQILDFGIPEVDALEPGQYGSLTVPLFDNWREADVLYVEATDPLGRLIHRWSWPVKSPAEKAEQLLQPVESAEQLLESESSGQVRVSESQQSITLESGGIRLEVSKQDGMLVQVSSSGKVIPLAKGPVFREDSITLKEFRHYDADGSHHLVADFGQFGMLEWIMHRGGLVDIKLRYHPFKNSKSGSLVAYTGVSFSYPEEEINTVNYLGNGPYRVWKNRMAGVNFHVWEKDYNNSITGHSGFSYPEFKGYYSNMYWARFSAKETAPFTVYSHTEDLFLRLFSPEEAPDPARTTVKHPTGDISFMLGIPAIGTKFKEASLLGPQSRPYSYTPKRVEYGALSIHLTFDFR